jgi:hypothetical protein
MLNLNCKIKLQFTGLQNYTKIRILPSQWKKLQPTPISYKNLRYNYSVSIFRLTRWKLPQVHFLDQTRRKCPHLLQPGAEPKGVERGHMPPLNPQNFPLPLADFFLIPKLPTLNHSPGAPTLCGQSNSKTRRTKIRSSSFYHFRFLSFYNF